MIKDVEVINHKPHCTRHVKPQPGIHMQDCDSYYCDICNRWLESTCGCINNVCGFQNRPEKPE